MATILLLSIVSFSDTKIHWAQRAGSMIIGKNSYPVYAPRCSRNFTFGANGQLDPFTGDPSQVTCKKCQGIMRKKGLLK